MKRYRPRTLREVDAFWDAAAPARALRRGAAGELSDLDLLTLILGPRGVAARRAARELLAAGAWDALREGSARENGARLTPTQRIRLGAAVELGRRLDRPGATAPHVRTPEDVFELTADLRGKRRERFVGLYLNSRNRLIARETVSIGSLNASIVHPREVFAPALRHRAASLIVVHNHPSGETDPSEDDLHITRRLTEAGEILGVDLLDHVIVGTRGYHSLMQGRGD